MNKSFQKKEKKKNVNHKNNCISLEDKKQCIYIINIKKNVTNIKKKNTFHFIKQN